MAGVILATVVTVTWCGLAVWLGPRIGYLDQPDDPALKVHRQPAVPLGGVGVFIAIHAAALTRDALERPLLAASALVLVLGLIDDRRGLPPVVRLAVEAIAAAILVSGGGWGDRGVLAVIFGVALVVVAVNAVNLLDGLDGLAGSTAMVSALGIAWMASARGLESAGALELAAALAGFLILNWHPARVFLGDAGAYVVAVALAHLMLEASPGGTGELLVAASLLGVFVLDLTATIARRVLSAKPLYAGDREHLYDVLRDRGMSIPLVAVVAASTQLVFVVIAVVTDAALAAWQTLAMSGVVSLALLAWLALSGFLGVRQS